MPYSSRGRVVSALVGLSLASCAARDMQREYPSAQVLSPSANFENNFDPRGVRAKFGLNTADCIDNSGRQGVFVVGLNPGSVLYKLNGVRVGDKILQVGAHKVTTSSGLTFIIKRITPDTVQTISFERNGVKGQIVVIPPPWTPSKREALRIDMPYPSRRNPCQEIGLRMVR